MKTTGEKYLANKDASATDIAKMIRADIKAAVKIGKLPAAKYSVRTEYSSMSRSINVRLSEVNGSAFNPTWFVFNAAHPHAPGSSSPTRYAPKVDGALRTLEAIVDSYNYDNSDSQSDSFDVNFYSNVTFDVPNAVYESEKTAAIDTAKAMQVEADYIAREAAAGNPEVQALVQGHGERYKANVMPKTRHLSLVRTPLKPSTEFTDEDLDYLKRLGAM